MKKILLVGAFVMSAISFANTGVTTEATSLKDNKTITANNSNAQDDQWWLSIMQTDRGSDRK